MKRANWLPKNVCITLIADILFIVINKNTEIKRLRDKIGSLELIAQHSGNIIIIKTFFYVGKRPNTGSSNKSNKRPDSVNSRRDSKRGMYI